ncbi:MAG TPA: hypothetical protein VFE78_37220 [Gemmataceae bacterium]|jgi:tetratricopeptide (TPR) repeat protein|nr:hypothetical protein [Gemmataceae bacterium]
MAEHDFEEKFPDMRPLRSAPPLMRAAGCGFGLYGTRGFDPDTGSYVKTYWFSLLFFPLVALGAYRVADAPDGGWYFLGRVRLSALARLWNSCLIALLAGGVGLLIWKNYTESAGYLAAQHMAEADALAAASQRVPAARLYRDVAAGNTDHAGPAEAKLKEVVDGAVADGPLADAAAVCKTAVELKRPAAFPGLFERGLKRAQADEAADPRGALDLLDAVTPLAPNTKALAPAQQRLLEKVVAREPDNPEPAVRLAVLYEGQKRLPECEALLTPHANRLSIGEGARILGHILVGKDKFEQAHALLAPYVESRLGRLHHAEERLKNAYAKADQQITNEIKSGVAINFPYDAAKASGEEKRNALVNEYFASRFKNDPDIKAALEAVVQEQPVVWVALDLGIVLMRRAQNMADPKAREAELQKAEKTFLAVQGQAGQKAEYRLFLGQVYYWMGKPKEGRKLFDDLLTAEKRKPTTLVQVAMMLREVGAHSEARALGEEAYKKETDERRKKGIAGLRSVMAADLDDRIAWMQRADLSNPNDKATLATSLGQKAHQEGKDAEAARHLREAIEVYGKMEQNATSLHNGSLAYFALYRVTGERELLDKAIGMAEQAVALEPRDSILIGNAASSTFEGALRDIINPAIDLKALKMEGSPDLLSYLYEDRAGRDRYVERVRHHSGIAKARALTERLTVLAPKSVVSYALLLYLDDYTHDRPAVLALIRRLQEADLDLADSTRKTLERYQGKDRDKRLKELNASRERYEAMVKSLRKGQRGTGVTFAVAASHLASTLMSIGQDGPGGDPERVVALAEEAYAAAPSVATHTGLRDALLYRANRALARQEPAYSQMEARARRSLGASYLIAAALSRKGKTREAALRNPDVQRAIKLVRESNDRFPDDPDEWSWAMLRAAHPKDAAKIAGALTKDELHGVKRAVGLKLSPVSAGAAFQAYWAAQMSGQEAEGRAALKAAAARGVPLPFDP